VHRPYADASDLARIHDLLQRIYAVSGPRVRMTPGDLEYWRFQAPDPDAALAGSELWFDGDELVGFAWPDERSLDFAVHPEHEHLLPDVLDWGARGNIPVRDDDTVLQDLLRARGYVPEREGMHWYRVRDLDEPVAPAGREVRSAPDPAAIAKLHTARPISERAYRALPDSPFYRADLDLYVADPEGAPVAFTIVWYDDRNRTGLFEPVGCLPEHRRRGLAGALLREGLRRLRELGATHALVAQREGNAAAAALYESAGFEENGRSRDWTAPGAVA